MYACSGNHHQRIFFFGFSPLQMPVVACPADTVCEALYRKACLTGWQWLTVRAWHLWRHVPPVAIARPFTALVSRVHRRPRLCDSRALIQWWRTQAHRPAQASRLRRRSVGCSGPRDRVVGRRGRLVEVVRRVHYCIASMSCTLLMDWRLLWWAPLMLPLLERALGSSMLLLLLHMGAVLCGRRRVLLLLLLLLPPLLWMPRRGLQQCAPVAVRWRNNALGRREHNCGSSVTVGLTTMMAVFIQCVLKITVTTHKAKAFFGDAGELR